MPLNLNLLCIHFLCLSFLYAVPDNNSLNRSVVGGITGIQALSDGRVIGLGKSSKNSYAILMLNADGTPDTNFNGSGRLELTGYKNIHLKKIFFEGLDKVVIAGVDEENYLLFKLNLKGEWDTEFGIDGISKTKIDYVYSTTGLSRIVDAFKTNDNGFLLGTLLVSHSTTRECRFASFIKVDAMGIVTPGFTQSPELLRTACKSSGIDEAELRSFFQEADGSFWGFITEERTIIKGARSKEVEIPSSFKLYPDGTLDTSYGVMGKKEHGDLLQFTPIQIFSLASGDRLLLGQYCEAARLDAQGNLDHLFGTRGFLTQHLFFEDPENRFGLRNVCDSGVAATKNSSGNIFATPISGYDWNKSTPFVVESFGAKNGDDYIEFGHPQSSPRQGYTIYHTQQKDDFSQSLSITADAHDNLLVAGRSIYDYSSQAQFFIARLDPLGGLDRSFGNKGLVIIQP